MAQRQSTWLGELQALIANKVDEEALRGRRIAGILGDTPSTYAKSPRLWNAAFAALDLDATFLPFDVRPGRLGDVMALLRAGDVFLGGSVTVPYKQAVIPLLDEVDPLTARIGAVNVIVRAGDGRLVGYNTDGLGGVRALSDPAGPGLAPPVPDLTEAHVLLVGAGGAAQALAFYLWEQMTRGELIVANRGRPAAEALAGRLAAMRAGHVTAIGEDEVALRAPAMDVVINATVKGQAGLRKLSDGWTCLEPYSGLGTAQPAVLAEGSASAPLAFLETWYRRSAVDIQRNHEVSLQICSRLPGPTLCYDIIYAPFETTFLRHARWSGHPTLNGKAMNVTQAVEAFTRYVCRDWVTQRGLEMNKANRQVAEAMEAEWAH